MVSVNRTDSGSKPARTASRDHQKSNHTVRDSAQEKVEQRRAGVAARAREERETGQQAEHTFEQLIREQPLKSMLIAAGVGLLLGRLWMRH